MDKQKQIEEMAKDLEPFITLDREVYVSANRKERHAWMLSKEDNKVIAKSLVAKGWVKLPKDSIVLSREERQALEKQIEKWRQLVNELVLTAKSNVTTYYGDVKYCLVRTDDLIELAKQFGVEVK